MNSVVLAAGRGRRLHPFTLKHPKCLLSFGHTTLLRRHLAMLAAAKIARVAVIVGHLANQVEADIAQVQYNSTRVDLIYNPEYEKGNALSLLQAEAVLKDGPAIVLDADILLHPMLLTRLLEAPMSNCLAVDERLVDTGEEVKVMVNSDGQVSELGKHVTDIEHVAGESVGIYKFSAQTNKILVSALRQAVSINSEIEYEPVINGILGRIEMGCVAVGDLPWIEIDFPSDVDRAQRKVWPSLADW